MYHTIPATCFLIPEVAAIAIVFPNVLELFLTYVTILADGIHSYQ